MVVVLMVRVTQHSPCLPVDIVENAPQLVVEHLLLRDDIVLEQPAQFLHAVALPELHELAKEVLNCPVRFEA